MALGERERRLAGREFADVGEAEREDEFEDEEAEDEESSVSEDESPSDSDVAESVLDLSFPESEVWASESEFESTESESESEELDDEDDDDGEADLDALLLVTSFTVPFPVSFFTAGESDLFRTISGLFLTESISIFSPLSEFDFEDTSLSLSESDSDSEDEVCDREVLEESGSLSSESESDGLEDVADDCGVGDFAILRFFPALIPFDEGEVCGFCTAGGGEFFMSNAIVLDDGCGY